MSDHDGYACELFMGTFSLAGTPKPTVRPRTDPVNVRVSSQERSGHRRAKA
jgi:hypothetical protein